MTIVWSQKLPFWYLTCCWSDSGGGRGVSPGFTLHGGRQPHLLEAHIGWCLWLSGRQETDAIVDVGECLGSDFAGTFRTAGQHILQLGLVGHVHVKAFF